jgi:flagellar motor switch protein FliM
MREILTPDEIAALTAAFAADPPPAPRAPAGVRPLDLANQERPLEGRVPGLDVVLERFRGGLRGVLAACFGDVPTVMTATVGLVRFSRLAARLAEPAGLVRFRLAPLRGQGLLALPSSLVAALLQVSCGGAARQVPAAPSRELSAVELRLIEPLATRVLAELASAWEPITRLDCTLAGVETTALFAAVAAPDDLVVHADFTVVVAGLTPSTLTLVVPNGSLDPIRPNLQRGHAAGDATGTAHDARWGTRLRERLLDVPIEVAVDLGVTELPLSRLLELAVGDLLPLDVGRDGPVTVRVAGERRLAGSPGVQGGNNAVRITDWR